MGQTVLEQINQLGIESRREGRLPTELWISQEDSKKLMQEEGYESLPEVIHSCGRPLKVKLNSGTLTVI